MLTFVKLVSKPAMCRTFARAATKVATKKNAVQERHKLEKLMFGGVIESKKDKVKRLKKQIKESTSKKKVAEDATDTEAFWLSHLSAKDIKVFRKTSSGRYKAVDKDNLIKSVKNMIDEQVRRDEEPPKIIMPEIIVKNVTSVPMLAVKRDLDARTSMLDIRSYPAVTRILSDTLSESAKAALENWKQKMLAELGPQGFANFNRGPGKRSRRYHNKKMLKGWSAVSDQLSFGARFHACVRQYLQGISPAVDGDLQLVWHSVKQILPNISDVRLVESNVAHSKLLYKGVVDCVASYRNVPSVIEWKVSQKPKQDLAATFDAPLQVTAYLGALSYDTEHRTNLRNGLVVVAYKDGSPATAFPMDEQVCYRHWALWVKRLQQYWINTKPKSE